MGNGAAAGIKLCLDGMVKAGIIRNDNLMVIQSPVIHHYTKSEGRVIMTISDEPF